MWPSCVWRQSYADFEVHFDMIIAKEDMDRMVSQERDLKLDRVYQSLAPHIRLNHLSLCLDSRLLLQQIQ